MQAPERGGAPRPLTLPALRPASELAKTVVWGTLAIVGAYVAYTIAVGLHREFGGAKPPVVHSVLHHNERTPPPPS